MLINQLDVKNSKLRNFIRIDHANFVKIRTTASRLIGDTTKLRRAADIYSYIF
jgi:hypothetical protein